MQFFVNEQTALLNHAIRRVANFTPSTEIKWKSPLVDEGYAEYRDQDFINRLGLPPLRRALATFWPLRGACWDGLAVTKDGQPLLFEAKANIPELASTPTQASAKESLALIHESLTVVQAAVNVEAKRRRPELWASAFYQYANRIAHLYFLRECNGLDAHLFFVDFINDDDSGDDAVRSVSEWQSLTRLVEACLGIPRTRTGLMKYVHHIYFDVASL
jgi:hypothetical protein